MVKISAVKFSLYRTRGLSARTLRVEWGRHEPEAGDHSSHDIIIQPPELGPHPLTSPRLSDHTAIVRSPDLVAQVSCCFESTELFHWLELVSGAIMYSPWVETIWRWLWQWSLASVFQLSPREVGSSLRVAWTAVSGVNYDDMMNLRSKCLNSVVFCLLFYNSLASAWDRVFGPS